MILHVDMDSFFASVEVLDDPSLAGRPVIVGGTGSRGVVAACTYEARAFGVRSAMPSSVARRLCPHAVFLPGRYHRYQEESAKLHALLHTVTPLVEGISLDEAFLDVTGSVAGDGPTIAASVRERVAAELHLACSVGVGRSKLIAKLASKSAKPVAGRSGVTPGPGVVVVPAADEIAILHPRPVRALWGVGPATARVLEGLGARTVGDVAALPVALLERRLGVALGAHFAALSRGEDARPVVPDHEAKSIGHEETFAADVWDTGELHDHLVRMVDAASSHLRSSGLRARTVTLKVRFADFRLVTRSHTTDGALDSGPAIAAVAAALLDAVPRSQGVRLLGVSLSGFGAGTGSTGAQLAFDLGDAADADDDPGSGLARARREAEHLQATWSGVTTAVDAVRDRYGPASVGPASLVGADGLRIRRRGEAQWGPSGDDRPGPTGPGPGAS